MKRAPLLVGRSPFFYFTRKGGTESSPSMDDLGDWSVVEKDVDAEGRSDCTANDVALFREEAWPRVIL